MVVFAMWKKRKEMILELYFIWGLIIIFFISLKSLN
jgi:hypothetical protein